MKRTIGICTTTIMFLGAFGLAAANAAPFSSVSRRNPVEVTGCLQQGPTAKEYLLHSSDGTTWGINETDMLMNDYLGRTVTISGDVTRPTAPERTVGGTNHYLLARDLVVENESCQK
jgi:hypothetical protein